MAVRFDVNQTDVGSPILPLDFSDKHVIINNIDGLISWARPVNICMYLSDASLPALVAIVIKEARKSAGVVIIHMNASRTEKGW